jgi:phosphoglycerate dehydrogenase-like enzyme
MIGPERRRDKYERGLTGKRVGLIGCGHIGRRLLELLEPFGCPVSVFDPYIPRELAEVLGVTRTSLERVLSGNDVAVWGCWPTRGFTNCVRGYSLILM